MSTLLLQHLGKEFPNTKAVDGVSLTVEDGEMLTILGPSGCGKTTILRMVAGLIEPTAGRILLDGRVLADAGVPHKTVLPEDRNIGMVFQSYAVWPHMNVFDNVAYPLKIRKLPKEEIRREVKEILRVVHLEGLERRMTFQLSGGQQQRVALARSLVMRPNLLLLDEPLSNLDASLREQMRGEIKEIQRSMGITIINVTHDQIEAMTMSDRVALMRDGKLVQSGAPPELYEEPKNSFVARFIGSGNVIPARCAGEPRDAAVSVEVEDGAVIAVKARSGMNREGYLSVRAHHLTPAEEGIPVTVERRLYQGDGVEYLLRTGGGQSLTMNCPTSRDYPVGSTFRVAVTHAVWLNE